MEYGGEQSLNDLIEKRKEEGLKAFPAAKIEKVALHVARGLQVNHGLLVCIRGVVVSFLNSLTGSSMHLWKEAVPYFDEASPRVKPSQDFLFIDLV